MTRRARVIVPGYPHHIVQRGNNKSQIFFNDDDYRKYLYILKKFKNETECKVWAYCLMHNHVHLLLTPQRQDALAKCMQKVSLSYTKYVNYRYKRTGRLWECRYYSSVVDKESYLDLVCRYIERNPVRAKLVASAWNYSWSSVRIHASQGSDSLVDAVWQGEKEKSLYKMMIQEAINEEEKEIITVAMTKGAPIGSLAFTKHIEKLSGRKISR